MKLSHVLVLLLFVAPAALAGASRLQEETQAVAETAVPSATAMSSTTAVPATVEARPVAEGLVVKNATTLAGPRNFMSGYAAVVAEGRVHAVIEIPAGSVDKWEVKGEDGLLHWDLQNGKPRKVDYLGYPCNYGMVPRTLLSQERGGDGDPLDVLVLGAALPRGTVVEARVIGLLRMRDAGELDVKLIAVRDETPFGSLRDVADLETHFPGVTRILETWFAHYKGSDVVQTQGFGDVEAGLQVLRRAVQDYETLHGGS